MAALPLLPIAIGLIGATSVLGAIGSITAGQNANAIASYNAQAERIKGQEAINQSQTQAAIDAANVRRRLGDTQAAFGAAGVNMAGTPLEVLSDQATQGELTRRLDLYRGQIGQFSANSQAAVDSAQGQAQQEAGYLNAGTTLLSGAAKAAGSYYAGSGGAGVPLATSMHETGH